MESTLMELATSEGLKPVRRELVTSAGWKPTTRELVTGHEAIQLVTQGLATVQVQAVIRVEVVNQDEINQEIVKVEVRETVHEGIRLVTQGLATVQKLLSYAVVWIAQEGSSSMQAYSPMEEHPRAGKKHLLENAMGTLSLIGEGGSPSKEELAHGGSEVHF